MMDHRLVHAGTVALLLTLGQSNGQQFAGKWTCEYFGRTLARLELQDTNGMVSGRISIGAMHVDAEGKLDTVLEEATHLHADLRRRHPRWRPVVRVRRRGL
jgi:hypothetical protein